MRKVKLNDLIKEVYRETKRSSLLVYLILRILVIICMVLQIIRGDINNALLCLLSLFLLVLPIFVQTKFSITLPNALEITLYLFIFSAEILGEINNFYHLIPYWDTILHTLNGFLATAIGFSLIDLLNKNSKKFSLSPIYLCLFAFCFSMTIGVFWEFFEYTADKFFSWDMQKDEIVNRISSVTLGDIESNEPEIIKNIDRTILYDKDGKIDKEAFRNAPKQMQEFENFGKQLNTDPHKHNKAALLTQFMKVVILNTDRKHTYKLNGV